VSWFIKSGEEDARVFLEALTRHSSRPLATLKVLDFGAGVGRLLGHLNGKFQRLSATDVSGAAVAYLGKVYPDTQAKVNHLDPPLDWENETFDAVYAFSVWTHLNERDQIIWLRELRRILQPGGLALVSANGFAALDIDAANPLWHDRAKRCLADTGFFFSPYPKADLGQWASSGLPDKMEERYGCTIQTPEHIRKSWSEIFEILEIRPAAFRKHQDLVVMRKPAR
jgi:SAM-dependent methyltransferase